VRTAQAIINLALMTGNIGRPGTGANSITGQCNAMGSRLFSNTTNLLGGHDFAERGASPRSRRRARHRRRPHPDENGWAYDQIIEGIARGEDQGAVGRRHQPGALVDQPAHGCTTSSAARLPRRAGHVSTTETAQRPTSCCPPPGWGEKEGTFINSERRIGVSKRSAGRRARRWPTSPSSSSIAEYWGCGEMLGGRMKDEENGGTAADDAGARSAHESSSFIPHPSSFQQRRLFADGRFFHADGRAKFIFEEPREVPEPTDAEYPFTLLTGRGTSSQWHTQTRTAKSDVLRKLYPAAIYVEINPRDAERLGIASDTLVTIASRRAKITATAFVTPVVQPGQVFVPMHYAITNQLTYPCVDPYSRQPSYKACAVAVAPLRG
jgi:anaerobic selenocysteine-containing dehydrogenase